jgi:hypothetical protein
MTPFLIAMAMTAVICIIEELTQRCARPAKANVRTVLD